MTIVASLIVPVLFLTTIAFIRFCITIAALCLRSKAAYAFLVFCPRITAWIDNMFPLYNN